MTNRVLKLIALNVRTRLQIRQPLVELRLCRSAAAEALAEGGIEPPAPAPTAF